MRRFAPLLLAAAGFIFLTPAAAVAQEQGHAPPVTRAAATDLIRRVQRIATPEGIDTLFPITVGDNRQWVSIRGLNRANPVLVFIHGGPASPTMPNAWGFQKGWEDFFTVVQWDQRGSGKSFAEIDTARAAAVWTVDDIVNDAVVVIDSVRHLLGKRKVVVLGHSWGSIVGMTLAARRPDLLHAYVGVGQVMAWSQEKYLYDRVMELSQLHHLDSAIADLQRIAPYPRPDGKTSMEHVQVVRHWANRFHGGWYGQPSLEIVGEMTAVSPAYTDDDLAREGAGANFASPRLFGALFTVDLRQYQRFAVPIIVLQGRYDLYTPYAIARGWVATLHAPTKRFVTFERSAHYPMLEEPGRFLMTLVREVLPLTHEAATFGLGPDAPK
ncbi:MAG: alpha/beta hydrolase [Gemmatimonadota bacterium]